MSNIDTCISCGAIIPEGRQVCPQCLTSQTNFDRIKSMTVDELANFICDIYASNEHREIRVDGKWMFPEDVEEWLCEKISTHYFGEIH